MSNPILTSELINDDGGLEKILNSLRAIKSELEQMRDSAASSAAGLEPGLKKINVAYSNQREELKQTADQIEQLDKEYKKYVALLDENAVKIAAVKQAQSQLNKINKLEAQVATAKNGSLDELNAKLKLNKARLAQLTEEEKKNTKEGKQLTDQTARMAVRLKQLSDEQKQATKLRELDRKIANSAEGSYNQLSAMYSKAKIELNAMSSEQRENTKEGKKAVEQADELYQEMKRLQAETGQNTLNVGNYTDALAGMPGPLGAASNGVIGLGKQFKKLLKNPVILVIAGIVAVLGTLFSAFKQSETGAKLFEKVGAGVNAIWTQVINIAGAAAKVIGNILTGEFSKAKDAAGDFIDVIKDSGKNIKENYQAYDEYNKKIRENRKLNREISGELELLRRKEALLGIEAGDTSKTLQERANAALEANKVIQQIADKEKQLAQAELDAITLKVDQEKKAGKDIQDLLDQQSDAKNKVAAAETARLVAQANAQKEYREVISDLLEQELDILIDGFDKQKTINEKQIASDKLTFDERRSLLQRTKELGDRSFDAQIEKIQEFTGVKLDANKLLAEDDATKLEVDLMNAGLSEAITKRLIQSIFDRKTANYDLKEAEEELNEAEAKFNKEREERHKEEQERIKESRENYKKAQKEKLEQQREAEWQAAKDQLAFAKSSFDLLKSTEREKTLFSLNQQKQRLQNELKFNKKLTAIQRQTIANQIGLIEQQMADVDKVTEKGENRDLYDVFGIDISEKKKKYINDAVNQATGAVLEFAAQRSKIAEQAVQDSANEVQSAENALQAQIELSNQGHAADVEGAKRDLKLAKETQAKAIKQREAAQRQEILLQSALQAANLITATSNVLKEFTFPAALPILALMWGTFIASKARAIQLTKEKRSEGGLDFIGGGTHASGNDTFLNYYQGGKPVYGERGESHMVLKPNPTKRYKKILPSLFNALNNERLDLFLNASQMVSDKEVVVNGNDHWLSKIYNQGQQKTYKDESGNLVEIKGLRKTVYVS